MDEQGRTIGEMVEPHLLEAFHAPRTGKFVEVWEGDAEILRESIPGDFLVTWGPYLLAEVQGKTIARLEITRTF